MVQANPLYARTQNHITNADANGRCYGIRKAIEAIKGAVPIETYAAEHTELRQSGKERRGRCPIHGGDNPTSFSVNVERQIFHYFGCGEGGDLIDLCEAIERHADTWTAVVSLAMHYNITLPEKSKQWREWQNEKERRRQKLLEIKREHYRRRLFRLFKEDLETIEDPEFREQEAREIWKALGFVVRWFIR